MNTMPPLSNTIVNENVSLDAMIERLREIILVTSWNSRNISYNIFSVQHRNYREATKNHADSLRSFLGTSLKVLDVVLKLDPELFKPFLSESMAGYVKGAIGTGNIIIPILAHTHETHEQAHRHEEASRGDISKDAFGQAQRKKGEAEDTVTRFMQIIDGIKDLQRSTINVMQRKSA